MKYWVVQHTGFVPYFLCSWSDETPETDRWDCHRDRALVLAGPEARRIANQLNARRPMAVQRVTVEEVR